MCKEHGHKDIKLEVDDQIKTQKLEYVVQYRESDFNFISRLMEHYGISYYFEHHSDRHYLVLVNKPGKHPSCAGATEPVIYKEDSRDPGVVTDLLVRQEARSAKTVYRDYNFETPQLVLEVGAGGSVEAGHGKYELYDYHPGRYPDRTAGEALAKQRMQEVEGNHRIVQGSSTFRGMAAGHQFSLIKHPRPDVNGSYVVLDVLHQLSTGGYTEQEPYYHNDFSALPVDAPLRPEQLTPRPVVEGPQTAVVVGDSGEEIFTDKHGRVKVQFHWDRLGKKNEDSSCWVRVSQGWAGKGFGMVFLPRVGQEVIVDFLEGDPDQPILTGAVYNAHQTFPYELPGQRTKSTIKTSTYKGTGFNELRFEDKPDQEEVFIHAQKDFNEVVEHNHSTSVKADQSNSVSGKQTVTVKKDRTLTVEEGKYDTHVNTGSYSTQVKQAVSFTSTDSTFGIKAKAAVSLESETSTFGAKSKTDASVESTTAAVTIKAATHLGGEAGSKATLKAPDIQIGDAKIDVNGTTIKITGSTNITLAVGGSSIKLEPSGITISGPKITSAATGPHEITGALVKIN